MEITDAGIEGLGSDIPPAPQTTEDLLELWFRNLKSGERSMLSTLVRAYPQPMTREALGDETGFTVSGGMFGTYLSTLRRNGLVEGNGDSIQASESLFL